ncbi:MAG: DUF3536 domain-containing protein, partial [Clostridia bacterium]|nr:DUF3536 domain-containing protein [Clostridia bacterium]
MERFLCIHGHFYQPPRENPWLEDIELQDSAYPYHDWNERITTECYAPNSASRILDSEGWIKRIVNNYSKISFNFGPTLLSWMEDNEPETYEAIIEADRESRRNFSGHGSALAQAYNHMIMPLANQRDKYTQVIWGIKDFEHRFGRQPEGMWLPETAVDMETLDIMAEHGIRFTILAPWQARRLRPLNSENWQDITGGIDTTRPYQVYLPKSGRTIVVFFYNGEISRAVAFEKLLANGERFAKRLLSVFRDDDNTPHLVNIATDGETYGHHHPHGDMALAYALHYIEKNNLARITNYGEYLEKHPPTYEAEIIDNSSWSCAHGIERWRSNCGCNSGMHPGWNQNWRAPLRDALNWLRNTLAPKYEELARQYLKDPWAARNDYIEVVLDRSPENLQRYLERNASRELNQEDQGIVLKLLELQRHAMLMYTSCGWFFDELSGIETVQIIKYAGRVIQLAQKLFNESPEPHFLEMLARAKSNIPEHRDGAYIYEKFVKPGMVDLLKVVGHYALSSLFEDYDDHSRIFCYDIDREDHQQRSAGAAKLSLGRVQITSQITRRSAKVIYGVVHLGNHNLTGGVRLYEDEESYQRMLQELGDAFERADYNAVIRLLDQHFAGSTYTLKQLFKDKQRMILDLILENILAEVAAVFQRIYNRHVSLMRFLKDLHTPQPRALFTAAEFVLNAQLGQAFAAPKLDLKRIKTLLGEAAALDIPLDGAELSYVLKQTLAELGEQLRNEPENLALIEHLDNIIGLVRSLPFEVDLAKLQNIYFKLLETVYPQMLEKARQGDEQSQVW